MKVGREGVLKRLKRVKDKIKKDVDFLWYKIVIVMVSLF